MKSSKDAFDALDVIRENQIMMWNYDLDEVFYKSKNITMSKQTIDEILREFDYRFHGWLIDSHKNSVIFSKIETVKRLENFIKEKLIKTHNSALDEAIQSLPEQKKQREREIDCPDNMPGCCVYHTEKYMPESHQGYNECLKDVIKSLEEKKITYLDYPIEGLATSDSEPIEFKNNVE